MNQLNPNNIFNATNELLSLNDLIERYGHDLSNIDFTDVMILPLESLEGIILPDDPELFQKIFNKCLRGAHMGSQDFSKYNFRGIDLEEVIFDKNAKLPDDPEFFQTLDNKSIKGVMLPEQDLSNYNFKGVNITYSTFRAKTFLPKDTELFQYIHLKLLLGTTLPEQDFSDYNFKDVALNGANFPKKALIPLDQDFFQNLLYKDISDVTLPDGKYGYYDFNEIRVKGLTFSENSDFKGNPNLFQGIKDNTLYKVHFKGGDLTTLKFDNIILHSTIFGDFVKLPEEYNFLHTLSMKEGFNNIKFPKCLMENLYLYNTSNISIDYELLDIPDYVKHIFYKRGLLTEKKQEPK